VNLSKYIGRHIDLIYIDRAGHITQRQIYVHSVRDGVVRAFCLTSGAPRTFRAENVLAALPTSRRTA